MRRLLHIHRPTERPAGWPGYASQQCRCGAVRYASWTKHGTISWATRWGTPERAAAEMRQHTRDSGIGPEPTTREILRWYARFAGSWFAAWGLAVAVTWARQR